MAKKQTPPAEGPWPLIRCHKDEVGSQRGIFSRLWSGEIAALLIEGFWPAEECARITARVNQTGIQEFDYGTAVVKTIGIFLMQYANNPAAYFEQAAAAEKTFGELFMGVPDPRDAVRDALSTLAGQSVRVPRSPDGVPYSASVLRIHDLGEGAPLHRDKALVDAMGFEVSQYAAQLSAVLMIHPATTGGELVLYRKRWDKTDEAYKHQGALGYRGDAVAETDSVSVQGGVGDLYVLNPSFFHEIRPVRDSSRRITLGTFVAFDPDALKNGAGDLVAWS
ncbi:MAG: hypothetical protein V4671_12295 [Armatimonadota bacterium]